MIISFRKHHLLLGDVLLNKKHRTLVEKKSCIIIVIKLDYLVQVI